MSTLRYWVNQAVVMQSAIGAVQAIDAISLAAPGVITKNAGAALPSNGDYVLLTVTGMRQLNNRIFKVSGAAGSTFNIGESTVGYDAFASGSYQVITFGHAFDSIRDLQSGGGDPVFEDIGTVHDAEGINAIIESSPMSFSCTHNWDPTFAPLVAAKQAFMLKSPRAFKLSDPGGAAEYAFYAYVNAPGQPTVSGKKKVTPLAMSLLAPGTGI